MKNKPAAYVALSLFAIEVILAFTSWLLSASLVDCGIRSMLGSEGIRWFLGHYVDFLNTQLLVWLVLLAVAYGCCRDSGICNLFVVRRPLQYRQRIALCFAIVVLVVYVATILALTIIPHAVLLSVTGQLFPSPFSASLVPILSFGVCLLSIVYGSVSGTFSSVSDVYHSLFKGIETAAPLFFIYILLIQIYYSVMFIFMKNPNF